MAVKSKIHTLILKKTIQSVPVVSLFFSLTASNCEQQECNYITDYYQLVYDAQLEYLKENYDSAYILLKKAKSNCELLNQPETREAAMYATLCARKGLYDEAFYYLRKVLKEGFKFKALEYYEGIPLLYNDPRWGGLKSGSPGI